MSSALSVVRRGWSERRRGSLRENRLGFGRARPSFLGRHRDHADPLKLQAQILVNPLCSNQSTSIFSRMRGLGSNDRTSARGRTEVSLAVWSLHCKAVETALTEPER